MKKPITFNWPAIRALNIALGRSDRLHNQMSGWDADRLFDGGEWSDNFHAKTVDKIERRISQRVAFRFGMSGSDLYDQLQIACLEQSYQQQRAVMARVEALRPQLYGARS